MAKLRRQADPPSMKLFDNDAEEEPALGGPRIRSGRDSVGSRRTCVVAGMGRFRGAARAGRRILARSAQAFQAGMATTPRFTATWAKAASIAACEFDLRTEAGLENYRAFMDEAASLVVGYGGSLSGEHGDGQARAQFLPKHVRRGDRTGLSRVQVNLGSRMEDESGKGRRPLRDYREPAARHSLQSARSAYALPFPATTEVRSRTPPCGAWEWESAGANRAARCARVTW